MSYREFSLLEGRCLIECLVPYILYSRKGCGSSTNVNFAIVSHTFHNARELGKQQSFRNQFSPSVGCNIYLSRGFTLVLAYNCGTIRRRCKGHAPFLFSLFCAIVFLCNLLSRDPTHRNNYRRRKCLFFLLSLSSRFFLFRSFARELSHFRERRDIEWLDNDREISSNMYVHIYRWRDGKTWKNCGQRIFQQEILNSSETNCDSESIIIYSFVNFNITNFFIIIRLKV